MYINLQETHWFLWTLIYFREHIFLTEGGGGGGGGALYGIDWKSVYEYRKINTAYHCFMT